VVVFVAWAALEEWGRVSEQPRIVRSVRWVDRSDPRKRSVRTGCRLGSYHWW
jgi:hypothetical protein